MAYMELETTTTLKSLLCCSSAARLATFLCRHSPMASVKHLFIIATITHNNSTWTWHPTCWSKQAELASTIHLSPNLIHSLSLRQCHLLIHSDGRCATSFSACTFLYEALIPPRLAMFNHLQSHTHIWCPHATSLILTCPHTHTHSHLHTFAFTFTHQQS